MKLGAHRGVAIAAGVALAVASVGAQGITQPKQGLTRGKVFLKGRRLYQIFVMGTESFANSASATKFLDSFKLSE